MLTYRIRFWTGPTRVADYGARARASFPGDVFEGTEHVYFDVDARDETDAVRIVRDTLGVSFVRVSLL